MPKFTKRNNDNVFEAPFILSNDIPTALADEIMDVVRSTRFHRVSIALIRIAVIIIWHHLQMIIVL